MPPRMPQTGDGDDDRDVRVTADRETAEEWALVLAAEGLSTKILRRDGRSRDGDDARSDVRDQDRENARDRDRAGGGGERRPHRGYALRVPFADLSSATAALATYDAENPGDGSVHLAPAERMRDVDRIVALAVATALVCFFAITGPAHGQTTWFTAGAGDARRILSGDFSRTLTSLTLHADLGHVVANALFGGLFLAAASAGFGPGLALTLTLAAGACGNLANAVFQGPDHVSIGASTAVFGAVGLLAGRALAGRMRSGGLGLRRWVPIAAGLALLAMLGTSARSDVWAHLFGFLAGVPIGTLATLASTRVPGTRGQVALGLAGCGSLWLAWHAALA